jgi:hypothetical protein
MPRVLFLAPPRRLPRSRGMEAAYPTRWSSQTPAWMISNPYSYPASRLVAKCGADSEGQARAGCSWWPMMVTDGWDGDVRGSLRAPLLCREVVGFSGGMAVVRISGSQPTSSRTAPCGSPVAGCRLTKWHSPVQRLRGSPQRTKPRRFGLSPRGLHRDRSGVFAFMVARTISDAYPRRPALATGSRAPFQR